jgi:hypothetical protein
MSAEPRLKIYVTNQCSSEPLPRHYLELDDATVLTSSYANICPREQRSWRDHDWVVTGTGRAASDSVIDCSLTPRSLPA